MSTRFTLKIALALGLGASATNGFCNAEELVLSSSFQLTINEGDKTVGIGHALLSADKNGQIYLLSAAHVLKIACENSNEFSLLSIKTPHSEFKLQCPEEIAESTQDIFFTAVNIPSIDPQTLASLNESESYVVGGPSENSFTLCDGIDNSEPRPYLPIYNGKFLMFNGNSRIGCSGSGLFSEKGNIVGVLKGFQLASKNPLYIPVSTKLFQKNTLETSKHPLVAREIINSGRGDPIDGGNRLSSEYTLAVDNKSVRRMIHLNFAGLKTSDFIVHTPPISTSKIIPQMSYCYVAKDNSWISHLRQQEKDVSYEKINNWPFRSEYFEIIEGTPTTISQIMLQRDEDYLPMFSTRMYPNLPEDVLNTVQKNGDTYQLSLMGDKTVVRLLPGRLQIFDKDLGTQKYEFEDHNLCYRAVSLKNSETGLVITFNISLELVYDHIPKVTNMQYLLSRSEFKNEEDFKKGIVHEMSLYRLINSWRKK